jgi:tubulin-specific chaperone B
MGREALGQPLSPYHPHQMTIAALKDKLATHTGTAAADARLSLLAADGSFVADLDDDSRPLGYYSPTDGATLVVVDVNPHSLASTGWLEDTSKVEKYEMSEEAYNARADTFRKYAAAKRAVDPTWTPARELAARRGEPLPPPHDPDAGAEAAAALTVGACCEVAPGGRRGTVRFVGRDVPSLPAGWWAGVEYDEPLGRNDGRAPGGARLFECPPQHGAFVRPAAVTVGDFPPLEVEFGSDDEI